MFGFIVAIPPIAAGTCPGNDTINIMVTRRSTHAIHTKPSVTAARRMQRHAAPQAGRANSHAKGAASGIHVPLPNGELLLTRRHFLFGALGIGALAAIGGGASVLIQGAESDTGTDLPILTVPNDAVTVSDSLTPIEDPSTRMNLMGSFELPYGTLLWANGDDVAACLLPNAEEAKPLAQVGLLSLASGACPVVLEQAVGQDDGFDIYDVRATSSGIIWTEADILSGIWRIYTAESDGSSIGRPSLVDERDDAWEMPTITAVGMYAFWQVLPKLNGLQSAEDSLVKRATMGSNNTEIVYTSHGRLCTPPYALDDSIVITPRADTTGTYYQLTHLDAASGNILDTLVLPRSMRPLEAGYGDTGFTFSFDASYSYGDGISNMGTYVPISAVTDGAYNNASWFRFNRSPTAAPAWCGPYFMVKSSTSVCGVDMSTKEYFAFSVENGAEDYGEYLASTGSNEVVVTYTNIDDKPVDEEPKKYCLVKVWRPVA